MLSTVHISAGNASKRLETKCLPDIPSFLQYFTGHKEWSETYLGQDWKGPAFLPFQIPSYMSLVGRAEGLDRLCSFRLMPLTSPYQTASFYDFFPMWKKKKDFLLQAMGWGLFGYPFVSTCRQLSLLFVLFAIFWSCKDKLYLLFKLLLLKYYIYVRGSVEPIDLLMSQDKMDIRIWLYSSLTFLQEKTLKYFFLKLNIRLLEKQLYHSVNLYLFTTFCR